MSGFTEEFGFVPPELLYKCDQCVKTFHQLRGSGKDFVIASHILSAHSPYLQSLERNAVSIEKMTKFLVISATILTIVVAILVKMMLLLALLPIAFVAKYYFGRMVHRTIVQQRAIIVAVEALTIDFSGWGTLFPKARAKAETIIQQDASYSLQLIDLYLPPERRRDSDIVEMFAPSEGAIASREAGL